MGSGSRSTSPRGTRRSAGRWSHDPSRHQEVSHARRQIKTYTTCAGPGRRGPHNSAGFWGGGEHDDDLTTVGQVTFVAVFLAAMID